MAGRVMSPPPKDVHILIPRTHNYVFLYGTRGFADGIHLRILRWEDDPIFPDYVGGPDIQTRVLTREAGGSESKKAPW